MERAYGSIVTVKTGDSPAMAWEAESLMKALISSKGPKGQVSESNCNYFTVCHLHK